MPDDRKPFHSIQRTPLSGLIRQPDALPLPDIMEKLLAIKPLSVEHHEADSAAVLVSNLEARVNAWTQALPSDVQVAMYAMLLSGEQIRVSSIAAEGQNGIVIESPDGYILLIHQSNLQLLCCGEPIEEPSKRRPIGFTPGAPQIQEGPL